MTIYQLSGLIKCSKTANIPQQQKKVHAKQVKRSSIFCVPLRSLAAAAGGSPSTYSYPISMRSTVFKCNSVELQLPSTTLFFLLDDDPLVLCCRVRPGAILPPEESLSFSNPASASKPQQMRLNTTGPLNFLTAGEKAKSSVA
jgi:hypothetical protein